MDCLTLAVVLTVAYNDYSNTCKSTYKKLTDDLDQFRQFKRTSSTNCHIFT